MTTTITQIPQDTTQSQPASVVPAQAAAARRYIYCITDPDAPASFGPMSIGDNSEVFVIPHDGSAAVVSATSSEKLEISRSNTLAHQRVMEAVMQRGHTVLPVRFNTIAETKGVKSAEQRIIDHVLTGRWQEIIDLLAVMGPLVELGVKGL